jgi:cell wall assembly regulator SMI1
VNSSSLPELLRALEAEWQRLDAGIANRLRPGIDSDEIDRLTEPYGLRVPDELRTWWGWHDGASYAEPWHLGETTIGPGSWEFQSLAMMLDHYRFMRHHSAVSPHPDDADPYLREMYWHDSWLPITVASNGTMFVDVADAAQRSETPVYCDWLHVDNYLEPVASSFTDVVALWVALLRDDYYSWDRETRTWGVRFDAIPVDIRITGLV